jgi:hypothetical protein
MTSLTDQDIKALKQRHQALDWIDKFTPKAIDHIRDEPKEIALGWIDRNVHEALEYISKNHWSDYWLISVT